MKENELKHLYWRAGFGIELEKLRDQESWNRQKVVDVLFETSSSFNPLNIDVSDLVVEIKRRKAAGGKPNFRDLLKKSNKRILELNAAWIRRLQTTEHHLRERMTLFWANHFVCRDNNIIHIQQYNNTLRKHALGNFREFVLAIAKEASMSKYLNNKQNRKNQPNENFARELMELFTLGRGSYTEKDIKEAARAFTGWNHTIYGDFRFAKRQHDFGEKEFFGERGNFDGADIIDIILENPECARFVCKKIYKYFVNEVVNDTHVEELVKEFYPTYDIAKLMRYLFLSNWFYGANNIGTKIKSPIDLLAGMYRWVPYQFEKKKELRYLQNLLGQTLLFPPNVAGWEGGRAWINTNTLMVRMRLASVILNNGFIAFDDKGEFEETFRQKYKKRNNLNRKLHITSDWALFDKKFGELSPNELFKHCIQCEIGTSTKTFIKQKEDETLREFLVQLMSLPEYQMC